MRRCLALLSLAFSLSGCGESESCLDGERGCTVAAPCEALRFECEGGTASVRILREGDPLLGGIDALASIGDVVLENDRVIAVIDALDHPHYLAPSGGTLIDLATKEADDDSLNQILQATGLLPDDTVHYESIELVSEGAVQLRGRLDGTPDVFVSTRYEVRPCDPGVRVRTELTNLGNDPEVVSLVDGFYWGARSSFAFAPFEGGGFMHPELELDDASAAYRDFPYLASLPSTDPAATYACVPCAQKMLSGFQAEEISAVGIEPRIVRPHDFLVHERFIAVARDRSVRGATDLALDVRRRLFGERYIELRGALRTFVDAPREADGSLILERGRESDPPEERTPITHLTPDADGTFTARVPIDVPIVATAYAYGRAVATRQIEPSTEAIDLGEIRLDRPATIDVAVTVDGEPDHALVFVHAADATTRAASEGTRYGLGDPCAPYLGVPQGASPACNHALVNGMVSLSLVPGRYDVYASGGPFATIDRETIEVQAGDRATVSLAIERIDVAPPGTLDGDFHVHGGASFDSSFPDLDRVRAFLASGIHVLASTEHDVVHSYSEAIATLDADERLVLMSGVETTGHVLFDLVPDADFPQVIGHWNFWPLEEDDDAPYRGAPWDELAEPGTLFTRMVDVGFDAERGVIQLNHPFGPSQFGRDLGWARAIGLDTREPLPREFDGTGPSILLRTPAGARFGNGDYHTQEVMNTTVNDEYLAYRALWFYYLNQGLFRAGTANSDSHTLVDSILGTPRNVVWTRARVGEFDPVAFNADVRAGHSIGTNGPVIDAALVDDRGELGPSIDVISPGAGARLQVTVRAAPWVPIDEVRFIVNGAVAKTIDQGLVTPTDPFGTDGLLRFEDTIDLEGLLGDVEGDAWIVVEAGAPIMPAADLDCDGVVDTGDNDGNGVIDERDVDVDPEDETPSPEAEGDGRCVDDVGPLRNPPVPSDRDDPHHLFGRVNVGGQPASFTNPFILDLDGGGWSRGGLR